MAEESIKVAVRVRPFNEREKSRNAKCIISMKGNITEITNPENKSDRKSFTFDHSYWSHDGYIVDKNGVCVLSESRYASQQTVFNDLGSGIIHNAFEGYNCSLFAYGQTGSGKSYSVVGYGNNRGIIPIACEHLFKKIENNANKLKEFQVTISIMEIYNEKVHDLLAPKSKNQASLTVRQSSDQGFFVQGLKKVPVGSYAEIEQRMEQGTANRTIAATNMNASSSRAHTLVSIAFDQITTSDGSNTSTRLSSLINFVDLAGSERADSTGATGDRLKEGANINRSLSALGNVISIEKKANSSTSTSIGDEMRTSKTVMIAALSPADINYDETLSTLRYADRAKNIKTSAVVNDKSQDKMIRELAEENERLRRQLMELTQSATTVVSVGLSPEEREQMQAEMRIEIMAQLQENSERLESQTQEAFLKKLDEARKEATEARKISVVKAAPTCPFISNLNEDPQLSGVIVHLLDADKIIVGRDGAPGNLGLKGERVDRKTGLKTAYILLKGLNIQNIHATFTRLKDGRLEISVGGNTLRNTKINGTILTTSQILNHMDRILFGSYHLYVYRNTAQKVKGNVPEVNWDFAQKELAEGDGIDQFDKAMDNKDQHILQNQLIELMPMVREVNAISREMNKNRIFDILLLPPILQRSIYGQGKTTKIVIRVKCEKTGHMWMWERGKFMNRRFIIQEIYQERGDEERKLTRVISNEDDPFWDAVEPLMIGFAPLFLQSLSYGLDYSEKLQISNLDGEDIGRLNIQLQPCYKSGQTSDRDDFFVENSKDLLGKPFYFKVGICELQLVCSSHRSGLSLCYRVYKEIEETTLRIVFEVGKETTNINHSRQITFTKLTNDHLEYLSNGCIAFLIFVEQGENQEQHLKISHTQVRKGSMAVIQSIDDSVASNLRQILKKKRDERSYQVDLKQLYSRFAGETPSAKAFERLLEDLQILSEAPYLHASISNSDQPQADTQVVDKTVEYEAEQEVNANKDLKITEKKKKSAKQLLNGFRKKK